MRHPTIIFIAVLAVTACKREPPPARPEPVRVAQTTQKPNVSSTDAGALESDIDRWKVPRLAQRGKRLPIERSDNGLRIAYRGSDIMLPTPTFGDCIDTLPSAPAPDHLPEVSESAQPVWATLHGPHGEAALMMTTTAAILLVDDGCTRAADITSPLLGQTSRVDDPVFTAEALIPEGAKATSEGVRLHDERLLVDDVPLMAIRPDFDAEQTVESWQLAADRWARIALLNEDESVDEDSVVGREHLMWVKIGRSDADVLVRSDLRFGAEGPDREDSETRIEWTTPAVHVEGTRVIQADALNVGAGRCPEMEGAVVFERVEEIVKWALIDGSGERVPLGRTTRKATYASGCPNVANEELRSRKKMLSAAAVKGDVDVE